MFIIIVIFLYIGINYLNNNYIIKWPDYMGGYIYD